MGTGNRLKPYGADLSTNFSPADVEGLVLWLEDDSGVYQSNGGAASGVGDPVGYWQDKSGQDNHVEQFIASLKPTLRADGVEFDGAGDNLVRGSVSGLSTQPLTWLVAVTILSGFNNNGGIATNYTGTVSGEWQLRVLSTRFMQVAAGMVGGLVTPTQFTEGTLFVGTAVFNTSSSHAAINKNGQNGDAGSNTAFDGLLLGASASAFLKMKLRAAVLYDSALGVADRNAVRDYLLAKYI